ncbi:KHG/KDPG aldolase [Glycine soja]
MSRYIAQRFIMRQKAHRSNRRRRSLLPCSSNLTEVAMEAAKAAIAGGISVLEIVESTPEFICLVRSVQVLQQLVKEHPTMALEVNPPKVYEFGEHIIVGTVLKIEDAKSAINVRAKFLMSPATVKDIMEMDYVQSGEILYISGTMTPTEILSACDEGAKIVKIYPVSALGGFQYISTLKKAFPHIFMVACQGITIDSIGEYILRGASAVVLSYAIFDKDAIAQHDLDKIQKLAHSATLVDNKSVNSMFPQLIRLFHN